MSKEQEKIEMIIKSFNDQFNQNITDLNQIQLHDQKIMKTFVKNASVLTKLSPIYIRNLISSKLSQQKPEVVNDVQIQIENQLCLEVESRLQKRYCQGSVQAVVYRLFQDIIRELRQEYSITDQKQWASCYFKMQKVLVLFTEKKCTKYFGSHRQKPVTRVQEEIHFSRINLDDIVGSLDQLDEN